MIFPDYCGEDLFSAFWLCASFIEILILSKGTQPAFITDVVSRKIALGAETPFFGSMRLFSKK